MICKNIILDIYFLPYLKVMFNILSDFRIYIINQHCCSQKLRLELDQTAVIFPIILINRLPLNIFISKAEKFILFSFYLRMM